MSDIKSLVERLDELLSNGFQPSAAIASEALAALKQQAARIAILENERDELRSLHTSGCQRAYEYMGIEDDGEYRWKWVLLGIAQLADEVSGLRATRTAYASEFPLNADGEPDVGNIHANIRAMKKDAERYREISSRCVSIDGSDEKTLVLTLVKDQVDDEGFFRDILDKWCAIAASEPKKEPT